MRTLLLTLGSLTLSVTMAAHAFHLKRQFYPAIVYMTKSNVSVAVFYIQVFVLGMLACKMLCNIFFGRLRQVELNLMHDPLWYMVTDTCLTFMMFRDSLTPRFVGLIVFLVFIKCVHWLLAKRVDYMERSPNISFLFNLRVVSLLVILFTVNFSFIELLLSIKNQTDTMIFVLTFEYAILMVRLITIFVEYLLNCHDLLLRDHPWSHKSACMLYLDLLSNFLKILINAYFMVQMTRIQVFPIFMVRSFWVTLRAFRSALINWNLSRLVINQMNTQFPNATAEELLSGDNVCIICREEMQPNGNAKRLPCNHIFHVACLRSWFQRQQTCPTCRRNVLQHQANVGTTPNAVRPPPQPNAGAAANPQGNPQAAMNQVLVNWLNVIRQHQENQQQQQQVNPPAANAATQQPPQTPQVAPVAPGTQPSASGSTASTSSTTNATAPTESSAPNPAITVAPVMAAAPLFGFPFMPFMPFPPMPLLNIPATSTSATLHNFASLTEQQLRQIEGDSRLSLEARIRWLENMRNQIDLIVSQFQQYNQVVSATNGAGNSATATTSADAPPSPPNFESEPKSETMSAASPEKQSPLSSDSISQTSENRDTPPALGPDDDQSSSRQVETIESQDEIRQRRLRIFEQSKEEGSVDTNETRSNDSSTSH